MELIHDLHNRSLGKKVKHEKFLRFLHKMNFSDTIQVIRNSDILVSNNMYVEFENYLADFGTEIFLSNTFCKKCGNYMYIKDTSPNKINCNFYKCLEYFRVNE